MCGIVGYVGDRDCADVLVDALSKLEYRGYDSAGIAVYDGQKILMEKVKGRLQNLRDLTQDGKNLPAFQVSGILDGLLMEALLMSTLIRILTAAVLSR